MPRHFILASSSNTRATLLRNAGLNPEVFAPRVDEHLIRHSLEAQGLTPRDIADALAEAKARKVSAKFPDALVLGCDQVAAFAGTILSKPDAPEAAKAQLGQMSGKAHHLFSAAVLYHDNRPVWRHVGKVEMQMRPLTRAYIAQYVERNWVSIRDAVGAYKLEEEGVRLFSAVRGDYFHVLGLPLIELLSYLTERGELRI